MLPSSLAEDLSRAAEPVIAKVLAHGGARTGKPRGEVSAVRTMTLDGFDEIATAWSPIIKAHGYRIDLRSVFCHSSPQVKFEPIPHPNFLLGKSPRQCELADLLIVIDHVDRSKNVDDRRAVLVQAKMLKGGAVKPTGQEWVQHELLAWLPTFKFVDGAYDTRVRELGRTPSIGFPQQTREYGGLDLTSSPPQWRHELTQTIAPWFHSPISLAAYLGAMATGQPLCGRQAVRGGADDWSFTVDELLRVTGARPITKRFGVARGNDNVVSFISDTFPAYSSSSIAEPAYGASVGSPGGNGGGDEDFLDATTPAWPEGPISTVHLTIGSIDDGRQE
ncbi:hypothetical protein [Stenotrophomonas maltophilia]|uniref:hypothetical protein n=1 Tax=Stenotrophomonas maltophilia TaxID=40324 RepID=UPI0013DACBDA|nr:hypothetical protein [Stenotrophomonas maltophilia]